MLGGMQDFELRVPRLIDHAEREHGTREIVTYWADGTTTRTDWAGIARDARKLAQALESLGVKRGDRIATLAMNHSRHLVAWYGDRHGRGDPHDQSAPVRRAARLHRQSCRGQSPALRQGFQPIVDRLKPQWTSIEHYVCFDGDGPGSFEQLIAPFDGDYQWVEGPSASPACLHQRHHRQSQGRALRASLLGDPRHGRGRAVLLRPLAELGGAADRADVPRRRLGPALRRALAGIKFVYAAVNDPTVLCRLMNEEKVTHSAGVPTVWLGMFQHMDATGQKPEHLKLVTIGGSAAPRTMIERLMKMGIRVGHAWA